MPIDSKRVEAAASLMRQFDLFTLEAEGAWEEAAKVLLAAAFPELASDPPTAWVAPVTLGHDARLLVARSIGATIDETNHMVRATAAWAAARDAHTEEQT